MDRRVPELPEGLDIGTSAAYPIFAAPPNEAAFKVIEESKLRTLLDELRGARSPLVRSVIYAEAGVLDEAEAELRTYVQNPPDEKDTKKLFKTIHSWRP